MATWNHCQIPGITKLLGARMIKWGQDTPPHECPPVLSPSNQRQFAWRERPLSEVTVPETFVAVVSLSSEKSLGPNRSGHRHVFCRKRWEHRHRHAKFWWVKHDMETWVDQYSGDLLICRRFWTMYSMVRPSQWERRTPESTRMTHPKGPKQSCVRYTFCLNTHGLSSSKGLFCWEKNNTVDTQLYDISFQLWGI
jgi:hypothetical protein